MSSHVHTDQVFFAMICDLNMFTLSLSDVQSRARSRQFQAATSSSRGVGLDTGENVVVGTLTRIKMIHNLDQIRT